MGKSGPFILGTLRDLNPLYPANQAHLKAQNLLLFPTNCSMTVKMVRLTQRQPSFSSSGGIRVMQFSGELDLFLPYILSPLVLDVKSQSRVRSLSPSFYTYRYYLQLHQSWAK